MGYYTVYVAQHRWLSLRGKHTRQKRACPRRAGACLTSLIGFFRARSQGDEKLYQAEIINFVAAAAAAATAEFADTSLLSENEEGEGNDIPPHPHPPPLLLFFLLLIQSLLLTFFFSFSLPTSWRRHISGGNASFLC